eukprot:703315-Pelagomonas_calceolata.AAC.3
MLTLIVSKLERGQTRKSLISIQHRQGVLLNWLDPGKINELLQTNEKAGCLAPVFLIAHFGPEIFDKAPVTGHKPLGLPASGTVPTWLPWPTHRTSCPGTLAALLNKIAWQPCSVSGRWEAVAGAVHTLATSFADNSWPEQPAYHPP